MEPGNEIAEEAVREEPPRSPSTMGFDPFNTGANQMFPGVNVYRFTRGYAAILSGSSNKEIRGKEGDFILLSDDEAEYIERDSEGTLEQVQTSPTRFGEGQKALVDEETVPSNLPVRGTVAALLTDTGEGNLDVAPRTQEEADLAKAAQEQQPGPDPKAGDIPQTVKPEERDAKPEKDRQVKSANTR